MNQDPNRKTLDAGQIESERKKTVYESPRVLPMGELARGSGVCFVGTRPTGPGSCTFGVGFKHGACKSGLGATTKCESGAGFA